METSISDTLVAGTKYNVNKNKLVRNNNSGTVVKNELAMIADCVEKSNIKRPVRRIAFYYLFYLFK